MVGKKRISKKVVKEGKDEEDCGCYAESHSEKTCPPIQNVTHPLRYYEFTQEEIKALEECDKESFYRRCLPFSTLFAGTTIAAIRMGYIRMSPHFGLFGAIPKVFVAACLGHLTGRLAYQPHCDQKLRNLSTDSHLGKVMRNYYLERNPPPKTK